LDGPVNTSVGYTFQPVENSFNLALAYRAVGAADLEVQIAVRSYRGGAQTDWHTLSRTPGASPEWTWIEREARLAEGADRGELVVVLKGEGAVWVDAISSSIPPQLFGTPQ
jgi:hypothetical protein